MSTKIDSAFEEMLAAARRGDQEALGELLDRNRDWLRVFAVDCMGPQVRRRIGDSDLVQQTIMSALRAFPAFAGSCPAEFQAWLKQIFDRNVIDTIRVHVDADCRSVEREARDATVLGPLLAEDSFPSPSEKALFGEEAARIATALESMPDDQRTAVRMRYLEERTLDELEQHFGRSRTACAGLVKRGLQNLRKHLRSNENG